MEHNQKNIENGSLCRTSVKTFYRTSHLTENQNKNRRSGMLLDLSLPWTLLGPEAGRFTTITRTEQLPRQRPQCLKHQRVELEKRP